MNLSDHDPGSLRDAINTTPMDGTVNFQPGLSGTISLSSALQILKSLSIAGPGANILTVSGNNATQVFDILSFPINVGMSGLTVANGSSGFGGGILNGIGSTLTLTSCVVANNTATGISGFPGTGGGIENNGGLILTRSTVANNRTFGFGGTTIAGSGGGIDNSLSATGLDLVNSTVVGNQSGQGGGIEILNSGDRSLKDSTVADNSANGFGGGGGIAGAVNLQNSIVASNSGPNGPDLTGPATGDHNLIGIGNGTGLVNGVNGNLVGTNLNPLNPRLGTLRDNSGPTPTLALLAGSPAIDAGRAIISTPFNDQRGPGFNRVIGNALDIGAYEFQPPATTTALTATPNPGTVGQPVVVHLTVTGTADGSNTPTGTVNFTFDGHPSIGSLSGGTASVTLNLTAGSHRFTALYNGFTKGDSSFAPSTAAPLAEFLQGGLFAIGGAPGRVQVRKVSDGSLVADFAPYGPAYTGPVSVAMGDVNGDQFADLVTGAAVGNPDVRVFDGKALAQGSISQLAQFFPYALNFNVGVNVAVGDINGDGLDDIVTGPTAGNPDVRVYSGSDIQSGTFNPNGASLLAQWFPYALQFNVGANVAVGDVNGDGFADVVTGATAGNPDVRVYNGKDIAAGTFNPNGASLLAQFFPYALQFNVGAFVAVGDTNGDGFGDVITGASVGNPDVRVYSGIDIAHGGFSTSNPGASQLDQFFAYGLSFNIGAAVASADFEGTGLADILTGASQGAPQYRVVKAKSSGTLPTAVNGIDAFAQDLSGGVSVGA